MFNAPTAEARMLSPMRTQFLIAALLVATACESREVPGPRAAADAAGVPDAASVLPDAALDAAPDAGHPLPLDPAALSEQAPAIYRVKLATTEGDVYITVQREWAPRGADRFYNLVKAGFYTDVAFFRVIPGFVAQFGIHGNPAVSSAWRSSWIFDDPVTRSNTRGTVTFATQGTDTRTTQLFINYGDNSAIDQMGFAPIGVVEEGGMAVLEGLYSAYGDGPPGGSGPNQTLILSDGNEYLRRTYPQLDYIRTAALQ